MRCVPETWGGAQAPPIFFAPHTIHKIDSHLVADNIILGISVQGRGVSHILKERITESARGEFLNPIPLSKLKQKKDALFELHTHIYIL